ncbi:uncharacterized protein LOC117610853 [Osmia lignaria lignaria]|uniref:uncharacterized protein LOC117610853 n=1 Tax=Osmia lignaria lignaria TaxID=1437193 RepID=UPI0014783347|nr:uncharacterized protein LOC117610853 [Osmia lignaria]
MVDTYTKDCRMMLVENREAATLIPIIKENVIASSEIHTDCCRRVRVRVSSRTTWSVSNKKKSIRKVRSIFAKDDHYKSVQKSEGGTFRYEVQTANRIALQTDRNRPVDLSEYKSTGTVTSPNKKRPRMNVLEKTSKDAILGIRRKVHEFWFRREIPRMKKMLEQTGKKFNKASTKLFIPNPGET